LGTEVRKSKLETAETRQRIVEAASLEFRRNGIEGTGLASIMAIAGLTHGGFYKHFASKDQLVEESLALAVESLSTDIGANLVASSKARGLRAAIADYLSIEHLENMAEGCPFVALGSEVARCSDAVRENTTAGFLQLVDALAGHMEDTSAAAAKKKALVTLCTMVGAMTMARIVTDPELAASILLQARKHLTE
jgi:TetR/AcrR family transcriptional regulator, transcriptional repressor for nem operon